MADAAPNSNALRELALKAKQLRKESLQTQTATERQAVRFKNSHFLVVIFFVWISYVLPRADVSAVLTGKFASLYRHILLHQRLSPHPSCAGPQVGMLQAPHSTRRPRPMLVSQDL